MHLMRGSRGTTLIEQLLALLLGAVMVSSLYVFFRAELYQVIGEQRKTATLEDARGALDLIVRDLKNAGSWGSGSVPAEQGGSDDPDGDTDALCNRVYVATATLIHVQMDLNGDGSCGGDHPRENLRYELTGPTATCPGNRIIRRNGDCLVANVTPARAETLFTYFNDAGADLGHRPALSDIKRVRIAFSVQDKSPDPTRIRTIQSTLATSVQLRN